MKNILLSVGLYTLFINPNCAQTMYENFNPMPEAKIYFSDKPFANSHEGSKTSFTSNDFIYGRLELSNQTLLEAFKMNSIKTRHYYLRYRVGSFINDSQMGYCNSWTYLLIKEEDVKNNWLNFDVMPEPGRGSSVLCGTEDFSSGLASGPLYHIVNQESFPTNGEYTIRVQLYLPAYNDWGSMEDDDKWPVAEKDFNFSFNSKDLASIKTNDKAAEDFVSKNAFKLSNMPGWFNSSATVSDSKLTKANIAAILKRDLPQYNMELIKFNIAAYNGPLWMMEKNELGVIKRRYVSPDINIAYKYDGQCYLGTARLWEEYLGGGKYGNLYVGSHTCNSCGQIIDCSAIK